MMKLQQREWCKWWTKKKNTMNNQMEYIKTEFNAFFVEQIAGKMFEMIQKLLYYTHYT